MEDYEQKYNKLVNAIKVLQETNPSDEGIQNWVNDNVPELSKSEDEKIKKFLISFIKMESGVNLSPDDAGKILAWLKKQGEKKLAWSEEDAKMLNNVIIRISRLDHYWNKPTDDKMIDWLKSLRPQNRWKPSDVQMQVLKEACDKRWEPDGLDPLYTLYEELEKLKKE